MSNKQIHAIEKSFEIELDDKEECIELSFGQDVEDICMIEKNDTSWFTWSLSPITKFSWIVTN